MLGFIELGKIIGQHIAPCPLEKLALIGLDLSAAGYTLAREPKCQG